jgi:hypothetical protein
MADIFDSPCGSGNCDDLNDRNRQLEGYFQVRLPDGASLDFFAFGETKYQSAC